MNPRRGLALIIVSGVLGILAVLAAAFVTMAQLERRASRQRLYGTKAFLLARSGAEDALVRLSAGQDPGLPGTAYKGEDWDDDGAVTGLEAAAEIHRPGQPDLDGCPVRHAMRPSFYRQDGTDLDVNGRKAPDRILVGGRERGYSGSLSADLATNVYSFRVSPEQGLYVNGGDVSSAGEHANTYDTTLKRILGNLAEELPEQTLAGRADGEAIVTQRPAGGWCSFEALRDGALGGSQAKLDILRPYLSMRARVDRKVIRPNVLPALENAKPKSWAEIRKGVSDDAPFVAWRSAAQPGFEKDSAGRIVGRAPVSLNWARTRRSVLVALIRDLKGLRLDETTASNERVDNNPGTFLSVTITRAEAGKVADKLMDPAYAGDLSTWQGFNAFCDKFSADGALFGGNAYVREGKGALLKANFNPNSGLNKFNPGSVLWKTVDKSDLLAYSTEFSLLPPAACAQELACVGRVLGVDGRLLASRSLRASVGGSSVLRLTTQREFVCETLGDPEVAGDESGLRKPGDAGFITESAAVERTWGHRLNVGGWMDGDCQGLSLQAYPEPYADAGSGLDVNAADYDGNLQLATVETRAGDPYSAPPPNAMMMLASYSAGLDLDVSNAFTGGLNPDGKKNQPDREQTATGELGNGLLHAAKPGSLLPDGCYSERYRAPAYFDKGNANGFGGLLSFWVKPNFDYDHIPASDGSGRGQQYVQWTNGGTTWVPGFGDGNGDNSPQLFALGTLFYSARFRCVGIYEIGHAEADDNSEHRYVSAGAAKLRHGRWYLVTFSWNFLEPGNSDFAAKARVLGTGLDVATGNDQYGSGNAPGSAADITLDAYPWPGQPIAPHKIILGRRKEGTHATYQGYWNMMDGNAGLNFGTGADATLDEFALYDFHDSGPGVAEPRTSEFAATRFLEGRYYKEDFYQVLGDAGNKAGAYLSPLLTLPYGARIDGVAWTWYTPPELPSDHAEVALVTRTGDAYLWAPDLSRSTRAIPTSAQFWPVHRAPPGAFRAQVVFRRTDPLSAPLLDSPVLDDLAILYTLPQGRMVFTWEEGF